LNSQTPGKLIDLTFRKNILTRCISSATSNPYRNEAESIPGDGQGHTVSEHIPSFSTEELTGDIFTILHEEHDIPLICIPQIMRIKTIIFLTLLGFGCNSTKHTTVTSRVLDGNWVPVKQEIGGTVLAATAFEKQKLVIEDSNYIFSAESVDKGIARYRDGKMDIYGREGVNTGKHFTAIYKLENDHLTICYNLSGDSYPEGFDTKGKRRFFLSEFARSSVK
jgi:uncharacterized protein (TIGR03067 family)